MGCAVLGAILLILAALLVAWVIPLASEHIPSLPPAKQVPFDAALWREGTEAQRVSMRDDLYESQVLLGKTREELESLLGPPSRVEFGLLAWSATAKPRHSGGSDREWPGVAVWIEEGGTAYEMVGGRRR